MSSDQFCQNCGLNFQRLSAEEEARYARDPGYCPNCAYPLVGNYPLPAPPAPPVWDEPNKTMPPTGSTRRRNLLIAIGSLLLVVVGLFVLLTSCTGLNPGQLLAQHPTPTATSVNDTSNNQGSTTPIPGNMQAAAVTQTAQAGSGSGNGSSGGGAGGAGGGTSPTTTPANNSGGGGGAAPTATPVTGGGGGGNPTATSAPPVVVTISSTAISVQCGNTTTIVMTNPSSTQTVNWTATSVPYLLSSTHGTIAPRSSQNIIVPKMTTLAPLDTVIITSGGVAQTVTVTCHL